MEFKKEYLYFIIGIIAIITALQFLKAVISSIITVAIIVIAGFLVYKYNKKPKT